MVFLYISSRSGRHALGLSDLQVAAKAGQYYTKKFLRDGNPGYSVMEGANFRITDDDLQQWMQGVAVLLRYVVVYKAESPVGMST